VSAVHDEMRETQEAILIVDASSEDYEFTLRGLNLAGVRNPVHRCRDGDEALDYLFRRGTYEDPEKSPRPCAVLLELNLPRTDGREVLRELKNDPVLKRIPVIVLTTSNDERDVEGCYRAGANSYIQKPVNIEGFFKAIQRLADYWFEVVTLPRL